MKTLADYNEKDFITSHLASFAKTARPEDFDDSIIIDLSRSNAGIDSYLVYSMDHPSKINSTHPTEFEYRFYGRWIAGCVCGDVIAMGAKPKGFSLDLGLPLTTPVQYVEEIYQGITDVLKVYDAQFEGGNIDIGNQLETVGMAWGIVAKDRIVRRRGARVGDAVVVTSLPGVGWAGYLARKQGIWNNLSSDLQEYLADPLMPVAPFHALQRVQAEIPGAFTSGMDLTDGLTEFLHTIAKNPLLGVCVDIDELPTSPQLIEIAKQLGHPEFAFVFDPGYDTPRIHGYTVAAEHLNSVKRIFDEESSELHVIAKVIENPGVWLQINKERIAIPWFCDDQFDKSGIELRWVAFIDQLFPRL